MMSPSSDTNPYAPPVTTDLTVGAVPKRTLTGTLYVFFVIQIVLITIAWGLMFVGIETIMFTGGFLTGIGCITSVLAFRRSHHNVASFALSTPVFTVFIFLLINFFGWGPSEANRPVQLLGSGYAITVLAWGLYIGMHGRKQTP